jgi:hypothetical protein
MTHRGRQRESIRDEPPRGGSMTSPYAVYRSFLMAPPRMRCPQCGEHVEFFWFVRLTRDGHAQCRCPLCGMTHDRHTEPAGGEVPGRAAS